MTATTEPTGGGRHEPEGSAPVSGSPESGATLIGTSSSYHCASCGAELAVDQHYCVECGTRRGSPRFKLAAPDSAATAVVAGAPSSPAVRAAALSPRLAALLAAIVVLLALGVGVLIGESGNTVKVSTVTVGASSSPNGAGKATSSGAASSSKSTTGSSKSSTTGSGSGNFFGGS